MKRIAAALAVLFACAPASALAEKLVVSLSNHRVAITSSFTGENLVLFGAIEPDADTPRVEKHYDIVVTAAGPAETYRTRRKARVLGIWVNVDWRDFLRVPSYLAVLANRPLRLITSQENQRRLRLGLDYYVLTQRVGPDFADTVPDDPFRAAFVRIENEYGLYSERPTAVTFLTPTVFRAAIPLPSQVPTGVYKIDVKLFADGELVGQTETALDIIKAGFEQYVAEAARDYGLLYGLATAMLALLTGWLASIVFRRD
jgi:uncharacterized protein (TIGR02186 family)